MKKYIDFFNKEIINEDQLLKNAFRSFYEIIDEAEYGSVFKYYGDKVIFLDTIGHDLEKIKNIEIKSEYFEWLKRKSPIIIRNINNTTLARMPEKEKKLFEEASMPMKESLTFDIYNENEIIAGISFDIGTNSEKSFGEDSVEIIKFIKILLEEQINNIINRKYINTIYKTMEEVPVIIAITDKNNNIIFTNKYLEDFTEYCRKDLFGKNPRIFSAGIVKKIFYQNMYKELKENNKWTGTFINKKKNGEIYYEKANISAIFDDDGNITNYFKVSEDVTKKIQKERNKKIFFNLSNNLSLIIDREGKIIEVSSSCMAHLGYEENEITGKYLFDFVFPRDREKVKFIVSNIEMSPFRENFGFKNRLTGKYGEVVWFAWNWFFDETESRIYWIAINITADMKVLENLEESQKKILEISKAKSEFISIISHELKTPISGILGSLDIVKNSELNITQKKFIDLAYKASESLFEQLNKMLMISKLEGGYFKIEKTETDLYNVIKEKAEEFRGKAESKELNYNIYINENISGKIKTDEEKLKIIISNIIDNSIKFTDIGYVSLKAELEDNKLILEISDTGCGIPEEKINRIYEKFYQIDQSINRKKGGIGLGLSIVKSFIIMMKGEISIKSNIPFGTVFTVKLPVEISSDYL